MARAKQDPQRYRPVINIGHPDLNQESVAYQEYWEQELDRCINGFKPKGMSWISGKYYFYLNYYKILGNDGTLGSRKTLISPWYRQMDHEYFDLFETCKDGTIKFLYIAGEDPVQSFYKPQQVKDALKSVPFLIVTDVFIQKQQEWLI